MEKHRIVWYNVTKKDATVIQCNATNDYGYIYTNAYLNVLSKLFFRAVEPVLYGHPLGPVILLINDKWS